MDKVGTEEPCLCSFPGFIFNQEKKKPAPQTIEGISVASACARFLYLFGRQVLDANQKGGWVQLCRYHHGQNAKKIMFSVCSNQANVHRRVAKSLTTTHLATTHLVALGETLSASAHPPPSDLHGVFSKWSSHQPEGLATLPNVAPTYLLLYQSLLLPLLGWKRKRESSQHFLFHPSPSFPILLWERQRVDTQR